MMPQLTPEQETIIEAAQTVIDLLKNPFHDEHLWNEDLTVAYQQLNEAMAAEHIQRTGPITTRHVEEGHFYSDEELLIQFLNRGAIIPAIKALRAQTGYGLKEAREYCNRLRGKI